MHIGVFGHYGNRNLGDEAIVEATIASLRRSFDQPDISCFSVRPEDSSERHGVAAYPIIFRPPTSQEAQIGETTAGNGTLPAAGVASGEAGSVFGTSRRFFKRIKALPPVRSSRKLLSFGLGLARELWAELPFLWSSYLRLKKVDLLVVAGSNQFLDNFGGVMGYPVTLLKWAVLCKLAGVKLAFVSVGAGPINSRISKVLIRITLRFGDYISYRDHASRDLIEGPSRRFGGKVYPDLASNLRFDTTRDSPADPAQRVIGINPMPVYDSRYWYESDEKKYRNYIAKMANLSQNLAERGIPFFFFGTQKKDYDAIEDVISLMPNRPDPMANESLVRTADTVQDLMKVISSSDIVVATRFHGTALALAAGVPVLGICYYRKAVDLLKEMGQENYFVMLDDFDVDRAFEKFLALTENVEQEKQKIHKMRVKYIELLEEQYSELASLFSQ